MTNQPATLDDETIEKFRQIRDLAVNRDGKAFESLHEIFRIAQDVLHDHAPEFDVFRDYIAKYGSEPK